MKVMTNELIGNALNWAAAKAGNENVFVGYREGVGEGVFLPFGECEPYSPSTDWSQGGPIIEREKLDVRAPTIHCEYWTVWAMGYSKVHQQGPTPLIAAMRCYVASKLGDTVEVPEEFL